MWLYTDSMDWRNSYVYMCKTTLNKMNLTGKSNAELWSIISALIIMFINITERTGDSMSHSLTEHTQTINNDSEHHVCVSFCRRSIRLSSLSLEAAGQRSWPWATLSFLGKYTLTEHSDLRKRKLCWPLTCLCCLVYSCVLFVHWSVEVSREGGVTPKIDLLTKIPERGEMFVCQTPTGHLNSADRTVNRNTNPVTLCACYYRFIFHRVFIGLFVFVALCIVCRILRLWLYQVFVALYFIDQLKETNYFLKHLQQI